MKGRVWKFIFHVSEHRNQRWLFKTVKSFKPFYVCCIHHIILPHSRNLHATDLLKEDPFSLVVE